MARVLHNLVLFTTRLTFRIRVLLYWSLIYGYCALCTAVALLKLWWNVSIRPSTSFKWGIRETPPACLNDTSLGTHCYVRIKIELPRTMTKDTGAANRFDDDRQTMGAESKVYDSKGCMVSNGKDLCDCLDVDCMGCFNPCPECGSRKCLVECRCDREWLYDQVEEEGGEIIHNKYATY